ncbi:hypothetical protein BRAO375_4060005 [Bradyrhizobium sp. ORS 375]|uniref:hypothetical protein n=1 Tax=Bradyrhizobium sp. (strain ORS 375) TaxID=566679 RepID=UPI0002405950|nr:hypothetical protein [Bradyrhizobium sp. ORS 375]CCD95226.1 hypothetical protein BRAO375_4060005 [Bradyrhizobium sp. ORS 375]
MDTEFETVLPVYIVGDSHSLPYKNMVFREKWTGAFVMAHTKYIPGITAKDFYNPATGEFHPDFIAFLEYEGLVRNGRATHLSMDEVDFSIAKAVGQAVRPPLIMLTIGEIDVRGPIMQLLKDSHDFVPPFPTTLPVLDKPLVPWDLIDEAIEARLRPFAAGLEHLVRAGFKRVYVQSIVPPSRQEARVKELQSYECPVTVRTKLVQAYNWKLGAKVRSLNLVMVDRWNDLTADGLLRPEFDFDGVHVPPKGARLLLEGLIDDAIDSRGLVANHPRYELYYQMACGLNPFQAAKSNAT